MLRNLAFSVFSLLLFSQCTQEKPDIRVVCETIPSGCYKIKWETFPPMKGAVKIYESSRPDSFDLSFPIAEVDISRGFKDVFFVHSSKRSYFNLVFNKKHSVITAERIIPMQGLFNFRDFGGYYNVDGKQICWGKMYRSSSLAYATLQDVNFLKNLDIRTIIDFRTDEERNEAPSRYYGIQTFNFPLSGKPDNIFFDAILSKKMKQGDAKIYSQDMFIFLLRNNFDYFTKMFDILLDTNNYPLIIYCSMGGFRSSVASALILAALDIDMDQIINDYMLTNEQVNFNELLPRDNIFMEDQEIQETFTVMLRAHKSTITYSFDEIIKEHGSLDNYFTNGFNLTRQKREKLKEILFY